MSLSIRLDTRVSPDVHERFVHLALKQGRSKSNLLRMLIENRVTRSEERELGDEGAA